jgi:5-methylcytosine-specific restriction endonuclease McrA
MAEVTCLGCGAVFQRSLARVKGKVFCSHDCRKKYHRSEQKLCPGCGKLFARDPVQPNRAYCTWACYKQSRHVTLTCTICHKPFDSYRSEERKRQVRGHQPCCSRSCRNTYTSLLLGGSGEWVEGGKYKPSRNRGYFWRVIRKRYLEQVGGQCEGCGIPAVEVHHLHPVAAGGAIHAFDNLMAVCKDCHENMHGQLAKGAFRCSFEGVRHAS